MNTYIQCFCEKKFAKKQMFSSHFISCQKCKHKFKRIDSKISRAIKQFVDNLDKSNEKEYINGLLLLKIFFKKYVNLSEEIINKNKKEKNVKSEIKTIISNINYNNMNNNFNKNDNHDFQRNLNLNIGNGSNLNNQNNQGNINISNNMQNNLNMINNNMNNNMTINNLNSNNIRMDNFTGNNNMMMVTNFNKNNNYNFNLNNINQINNNNNLNNINNINNNKNFNNFNNFNSINNMSFNNMSNLNNLLNMNNMNNFDSFQNYPMNNFNNINNMAIINNLSEKVQDLSKQVKELLMNKNQLSKNILKSKINLEEEITIFFRFLSGQEQKVKAKLYEIFSEVFERFHSNQCPPELKQYICYVYHNAELIDNNKTLFENGIKNGESVLFLDLMKMKRKERR